MTDVLGVCESWGPGPGGVVVVRREQGERVEIAVADIVSGKPVPPRPSVHRRLDSVTADRLALPGWPALEHEPLGEWQLRASAGFSSRGNSVLALGDPGLALDEAVARVEAWYTHRGLSPRAHVHPGQPAETAFVAAGWSAYESTQLMLASVSRVLRRLGPAGGGEQVQHHPHLDTAWLATDPRTARHGDPARQVLESGEVSFATLRGPDGEVLARGRGTVHGEWLGVAALWTREDLRGRGLGTAVLRSLVDWGAEHGATTTYLQVVVANPRAREVYEARGYEVHHRYDYLAADAGRPRASRTAGTPGRPVRDDPGR